MPGDENEGQDDLIDLYDEKVHEFDRWRERKQEIEERSLGEIDGAENVIEKRFDRAVETEQKHDDLVYFTITAFGPRSEIFEDTGWKLLGVEPLYERDPTLRNPDVLIGNESYDTLVMVECKTGLSGSQGALDQIRGQAEIILSHADYLERQTGCSFSQVERVLCVPGTKTDEAVDAIEQEERNEDPDDPIYLWKLHRYDDERLQLHTDFATRPSSESTHNSTLSEKLGDGIPLAEAPALTPEFFPDSHPYVMMENIFSEVLTQRELMDGSIRKFTRDEVYRYVNDQRTVPHYDVESVAEMVCDDVLERMREFDLIEPTESESGMGDGVETYEYVDPPVAGQTPKRILSNLRDGYQDVWVERKAEREAKRQAAEEFRESNPTIGDFVDGE